MTRDTAYEVHARAGYVALRLHAGRTEIRISQADAIRVATDIAELIPRNGGEDIVIALEEDHEIVVPVPQAQRLRIELLDAAAYAQTRRR